MEKPARSATRTQDELRAIRKRRAEESRVRILARFPGYFTKKEEGSK